jgi:hypothetical protein
MNLTADLSADKFVLGERAGSWVAKLGVIGLVALAIAAGLGLAGDAGQQSRFLHAYLTVYMYITSIAIGALLFVLLMNVTSAGWSATVRRIAELVASTFPVLFVLALPLIAAALMQQATLFPWSNPHADFLPAGVSHMIETKTAYLNPTFFAGRMVFYFVVWIAIAGWARRTSVAQDSSGDPLLTNSLKKLSAPAIPVMALTLTFFSLDLLMALDPAWYSTIFGVYYFAGGFGAFMALLGILAKKLGDEGGILHGMIRDEHYHDIGKLTFAFVMFWGYIAFSQYILIWYANIPEETVWYKEREGLFWGHVGVLFAVKFVIPFVGLMSRHMKRIPGRMVIFGGWMLVAHLYDMFFLVMPSHLTTLEYLGDHEAAESFARFPFGIVEALCVIGLVSIFAAAIARAFSQTSILAVRDPRMAEAMTFHNP